jgi:hypothetical protein
VTSLKLKIISHRFGAVIPDVLHRSIPSFDGNIISEEKRKSSLFFGAAL